MKAMVLHKTSSIENKPLVYSDVDEPVPGRGEVLLKIKCCGVCRTDLHVIEGELKPIKLPLIPGHMVVGVVEEIGEGVEGVKKGLRVGVPWLYWSCGKCRFCRRGLENLCENALFTGYSVNGGYAEYMVAKADFIHPIPSAYDDCRVAPLLCAGAIGYRALKLTGLIGQSGRLGLFGFGASAHLVLQIAKYLNIETYVFTSRKEKIDYALRLGADWAGLTREEPPHKLDAAIVFAPVGWVAIEALKKLDKAGRLVLAEIYMSPWKELDYSLLWYEREIKSVANVTRDDVRGILEIAYKAGVRPDIVVYSLDKANEALYDLKYGKFKGSAVLKIK
ncbi:MAG: alcohol dehydrogenase [Thermoprotei archaeon]|nr:MAG: alcohol dehydrogenase [Thermoprotei archaeon]